MAERRYTVLFYTAILVALLATYWVYRFLERTKENAQVAMQPVVVVTEDLPEGARLERGSLNVNAWPVNAVPPGAFSVADSVVGRVTRVPVFRGEPVVPGRLAPPGTGTGLEVKITPGKRAMSVKINEVVGLSGLIQPNSRVDVLVTLREEGSENSRARAKLFMNNMRVLSVGTQVERGEDGKPISATTATLEVTPEEAERLAVAANQGSIQLVLRGYGDPDSVRTPGATSADVLAQLRSGPAVSADPPAPAPRRAPARRPAPVVETPPYAPAPAPVAAAPHRPDSLVVQVYRGSKVQEQKFDQHDSTAAPGGP